MKITAFGYKKGRLLGIAAIFTVLFIAVSARIFVIQAVDGQQYRKLADAQNYKEQLVSPSRGYISDRNGNKLAVNAPVETITMDPTMVRGSAMDAGLIAHGISEILKINESDMLKKIQKDDQYEIVARKAENDVSDQLKAWIDSNKIKGIYFTRDSKRYYPGNNLAAQVIGFTGIDNQGLAGIEYSMEKYLKGEPGEVSGYTDAKGRNIPFSRGENIDVSNGLNVVLTLDESVQAFAEETLQKAIDDYKVLNGGTAIIMDPRNGDILAMVSKPDFNLNDPFSVSQKSIWNNKAVSSTYEPGSTFKTVTSAAALEEGLVTPDTVVEDSPIKVAGWTINSTVPGGRGKETFKEGVYNSDNPVFVKLAEAMGIDKFYDYVRAFGFFDKTGVELPGETNSIFQKNPHEIDMATASFGQSFQITPIQLITAYTAVENDGKLVKPRIIKELTDSDGNIVQSFDTEVVRDVISKQTADILKDILEGSVLYGTGTKANVSGLRIAGKTGTSQTIENGKRSEDRYIASFMGFAPANNPVVSVLVILDNPTEGSHYGGEVAAPVASQIMEYALGRVGEMQS